ncbi:8-amino-7-oxononanoate synthase [Pseudolysobacter antarcticus]|uniref:8-amino-7-oxononanoate synthase n=1 Tax=Pseudolysobacter antarcticus TaxID=2511995 RepID=A0A411HPE0_9GAMM|nr:8-amino-7-oxononanoate synthase [Pseudolysobacter antarcticus]QBB72368.1 8-amino-7-oxononanoate synthase [Pseudolysobacter antarcticus]
MIRPDLFDRLALAHAERERAQLSRRLRSVDQNDGSHLQIAGKQLLAFCSNDYLGLANHPQIVAALKNAADANGVGSTAAHLICGHNREHAALEEELADWTGRERALLFSTGYMANLGVLQTLLHAGDLCVQDKLNHASLLDAVRLSGAELKRYPHSDVAAVQRQLESRPDKLALLASDGVFSMDGDIAPLVHLATLCKKQQTSLMIDDAHGVGIFGKQGAGSVAAAGLSQHDVPVLMATLGKAVGTCGAFVAGSAALIDALTQSARSYIYTTALPPALAAATRTALRLVRADEWRREKLHKLIERFRRGALQLGLPLPDSTSAIQPILLGAAAESLALAQALEARGLLVTAIRPPTVRAATSRLRITLSAAHTEADVDRLLDALDACIPSAIRTARRSAIHQ